jgi:uncharacterized protein
MAIFLGAHSLHRSLLLSPLRQTAYTNSMLSLLSGSAIAAAAFSAAFISGIFGMAGGQILLAVLLFYMSVPAAMTVFSAMMFVNGAWRALFWRQHINWSVTIRYIAGSIVGWILILMIAFVPSKPVVYLGMGLLPFVGDLLPKHMKLDVTRRGMAYVCGFVVMILQISMGGGGNVLDIFFQHSPLSRHAIVATKAMTTLFAQTVRVLYFGALIGSYSDIAPAWFFAGLVVLSAAGTAAGGSVLNRLSDGIFRKGTRYIIWFLSALYISRGLWLLIWPPV